jgi:hypothetical protein
MIEVVGVLVTAADSEHPCAEHIGKAVDDARRIPPIREHRSERSVEVPRLAETRRPWMMCALHSMTNFRNGSFHFCLLGRS